MLSNTNAYLKSNNNTRRFSLFQDSNLSTNSTTTTTSPLTNSLFNININTSSGRQLSSNQKIMSVRDVCQRCHRFEVDLTNTSDDLNAIDGELKASRQVISLLQRQLELIRLEKEGLEKLIVAKQSTIKTEQQINTTNNLISLSDDDKKDNSSLLEEDKDEKVLLNLIQTQLYAKDEELIKLKYSLKETQNDKEQLILQLHLLEEENAKLKNENTILNENLQLRDQTIISLSNEVFEQSSSEQTKNSRRQSSFDLTTTSFAQQQSNIKSQRHIAKLIDTIDAYKTTNESLSYNVVSLTEKCNTIEKREIETRSQCQELEAKCCQIQSKLLSLLKEIEQSSKQDLENEDATTSEKKISQNLICSESVKLLIKRLLEDKSLDIPLSWKEGNKRLSKNRNDELSSPSRLNNSKYECDELGFYIEFYDDDDNKNKSGSKDKTFNKQQLNTSPSTSPLSQRTQKLATVDEDEIAVEASEFYHKPQQHSNNIILPLDEEFSSSNPNRRGNLVRHLSVDSSKSDENRWHLRWDYFIKDFDKIDLNKNREFKLLLRSSVPQEYRCKIWKSLVELHIGKDRKNYGPDYYQSLLEPNRPTNNSLNQSKKGCSFLQNPSSKQIELDLLRTLPNNKHFENLDSSGTVRLRRVLTAYSEHNPKVGYCQGMNRLAAVALLVLPEEEAFWCLATIVDKIMPVGYYNDLWLAMVDSAVVMDFVTVKMPNLSEHFKQYNVELSLFAWFLTIFVDGTPPALFLRLWDCFLFEGDKILFRVALALLKMYERKLLMLNNSVSINNFLRSAVNEPMNIDQFFEIAFEWLNPLSQKSINAKRKKHLHILKSENFGAKSFIDHSDDDYDDFRNRKGQDSPFEDSSVISV